jgi:TolB protein
MNLKAYSFLLVVIWSTVACKEDDFSVNFPIVRTRRNYGEAAWGPTDLIVFGHTPYDRVGQPVDSSGLWLIRPDGSDKRPLTLFREIGDFGSPDWSPDGKWIAAHHDDQIYKISVDQDSVVQLTTGSLRKFFPSWSPDGEWIAFSISVGDTGQWGIWAVSSEGSRVRHIRRGDGLNPDWSPDGKRLVFPGWSPGTQKQKLMIMDATGENLRVVFDPTRYGFNFTWNVDHPQFSPDASRIVFQMGPAEKKDGQIWVVNVDGSQPRQLTQEGGLEPSWNPEGTQIVYVKFSTLHPEQTGNGKLWIMNDDGSNRRQLTF